MAGASGGLVVAAGSVAGLFLGLISGVYADRWNRRVAMVAVDILRAVAVLLLALIAAFGHIELWHMALASIVVQGLGSLFGPCLQASLPALTDDPELLRGMTSLMVMTIRIARLVGPVLGGAILAFCPISTFFVVDSVTYILSAVAIWMLGDGYAWRAKRISTSAGVRGVVEDLQASARLAKTNHQIGLTLSIGCVCAFAWAVAYVVGIPLMMKQSTSNQELGVMAYAYIICAYGCGNVLSNIYVGSLKLHHRAAYFNALGLAIMGFGFLLIALAPTLPLKCAGAALAAIGGPLGDLATATLLQQQPDEHRGKLNSFYGFVCGMGFSVGLSVAPLVFERIDGSEGIAITAFLMMIIGLPGVVVAFFRKRVQLPPLATSGLQTQDLDTNPL